MRKSKLIPLSLLGLLLAPIVLAQEVTLTAPIVRASGTKYKIRGFQVVNPPTGAPGASVDVSVQDASNNEISTLGFQIPDVAHAGATVPSLITAMMTVRATETGTDSRKMQFRVLGYFSDQGYFPAGSIAP
jgi:predicted secreted protein